MPFLTLPSSTFFVTHLPLLGATSGVLYISQSNKGPYIKYDVNASSVSIIDIWLALKQIKHFDATECASFPKTS